MSREAPARFCERRRVRFPPPTLPGSRRDSFGRYEREEYEVGMRRASELIDPAEDGGPNPSQLQCSQHNGFGPCPGAPYCTPKDS